MTGSHVHRFDEILRLQFVVFVAFGWVYLNYKRLAGNRIGFTTYRLAYIGLGFILFDFVNHLVALMQLAGESDSQKAQQLIGTLALEVFCLCQSLFIVSRHRQLAELVNRLDSIFPRSESVQRLIETPQMMQDIKRRFRYMHGFVGVSYVIYILSPLCKCWRYYESGTPVLDECHQITSWLPFGLKRSINAYPFVYLYETFISFNNFEFPIVWDHILTVIHAVLQMHLKFLASHIGNMDARLTRDPTHCAQYYKNMLNCLAYQRNIFSIIREFNGLFEMNLLMTQLVLVFTICLDVFIIVNSQDLVLAGMYTFPTMIIIFYAYEIGRCGTELASAIDGIQSALYNHNWYEGSVRYRKEVTIWMDYSRRVRKLTVYSLFEVNLEEFQKLMVLAYRMVAFMQSYKS